jgi:RHS repeat-associated protein
MSTAFDNNGNTLTDDHRNTPVYDAWNRLISITNGSTVLVEYAYDGLGRRVFESPNNANPTQLYYSDQNQVLEEDTGSAPAALSAQYVWSPVYVNAMIYRDYKFVGGSGSTAFTLNERTYVLQDANYNVTALVSEHASDPTNDTTADTNMDGFVDVTDQGALATNYGHYVIGGAANGDFNGDGVVDVTDLGIFGNTRGDGYANTETIVWRVSERLVYDAYGASTFVRADWTPSTFHWNAAASSLTFTPHDFLAWSYTFQGGRENMDTGTVQFGARIYSVSMMRWLTAEPSLGTPYVDGMNLYKSFGDNPINNTDATGLFAPHVHIEMTQGVLHQFSGMDGWAKFHIIAANWGTDIFHFFNPEYHAQTNPFGPWVDLTKQEMKVIVTTEYHGFPDKDKVAHEMGRVLHGLQDFYSHTDWIEGNNEKMLNVYRQYPNNDSAKSFLVNAKPGHGVGATLDMDQLYSGAIMGALNGVIAYEGGTNPFAQDAHNLFSADDKGEGRDLHTDWFHHTFGYAGAFDDARNTAQTQTMQFVTWARDHMTCSMRKAIFNS